MQLARAVLGRKSGIWAALLAALSLAACGGGGSDGDVAEAPQAVGFPTPYAGTFYPLYNDGIKQYIVPTTAMPFDRVSAIFAAFAHAYPDGKGAVLELERGQPEEPTRLRLLESVARQVNPRLLILISLGWGHQDWTYISDDHESGTNRFPASVVELVRDYGLDGFDIDDEDIGGTSGSIAQATFDAVVANLRTALDAAGVEDGRRYYLTITPAGRRAQVSEANGGLFDLVNVQSYGDSSPSDFTAVGVPRGRIAAGIDSEDCQPSFPGHKGLAGMFNWTLSADSACTYRFTRELAEAVGYPPKG